MTPGPATRLSAPKRAVARTLVAALAAPLFIMAPPAARALVATAPGPDAAAAAAAGPASTAAWGARCIGPAFDDTPAFQAAIDTGHTVYAPALGGQCHITHALVMKTPGQIFHGDGRARTKIVIEPGFTGEGVFVAKTGGPGPIMRDFAVLFEQPDVDDPRRLSFYEPAFRFAATPAFEIAQVGCYRATTCIEMTANSGNSTITGFQFSAFGTGIDIDGSLDTVRIIDTHWWPFELTAKQRTIFNGTARVCPVGILSGRMDDLVIRGGLFGGCLGLTLKIGKDRGTTAGSIDGTAFDTFSGITMFGGTLNISSTTFSLGIETAQAVNIHAGIMAISSSFFLAGADLKKPMIEDLSANGLTITSSNFLLAGRDVVAIEQSGGLLTMIGNIFEREAVGDYRLPAVRLMGGQTIMIGNSGSRKEAGNGTMLSAQDRNKDSKFIGNSFPGWKIMVPDLH